MAVAKAEVGKGRGIGEALDNAVEVAGISEVPKAKRRALPSVCVHPSHLQCHEQNKQ